jgi:hypothetical protein
VRSLVALLSEEWRFALVLLLITLAVLALIVLG